MSSQFIISQSFVDIGAGISSISGGSGVWGDYDNDKDLDLLITGETAGGNAITKIYQNNDGSFSDVMAGLQGVTNGSAGWIDYDNDGDLDILINGEHASEITFLYENIEGAFSEKFTDLGYFGAYSSAAWGDFDNDGDPDLFLTGEWNSILYSNEGNGIFTQTLNDFADLSSGRGCWFDIDHDRDLDLLLSGDSGGGMKLFLYTNNNENFTETELTEMGLSAGSIEAGDYDSDGDLDILMMGFNDNFEPEAKILRNDGNNSFTNIYASLPPVALGRAAWGDYDNDGDLDVAITGKLSGCGVFVSDIYENEGNDYFNSLTLNLQSAELSYVAWADYDNDTDLDLFLCGLSYTGGPFAKIYRNDISLPNFFPLPPQLTNVDFEGNHAILNWEDGSDVQTPAAGLSYNIRIGTASNECDLLSPMAHMDDGFRTISSPGNVLHENSYLLKGLEEGTTYYWSVQTIDPTFAGSEFSEENSFTMEFTGIQEKSSAESFSISPNPAVKFIQIKQVSSQSEQEFQIISLTGKIMMEFKAGQNEKIDISKLEKGIYTIWYKNYHAKICDKLVVR